jgi:hypothetical protein
VTACGVWLGRRGLAAVLADGCGRIRLATTIPANDAARSALVELLAAINADEREHAPRWRPEQTI